MGRADRAGGRLRFPDLSDLHIQPRDRVLGRPEGGMKTMKTAKLMLVSLLVATIACDDREVTTPNNPNRETVVANSQDVLALISNGLLQWFNRSGSTSPGVAFTVMADEFSTGFLDFGGQDLSKEPRLALNNGVVSSNAPPHRVTWQDFYNNIAALNTALA